MVKFTQKRLTDLAGLAIVVTLIQIVLSKWIYPLFGATTQQLYSITPTEALTSPTVGNVIYGFLSGIIPFNFGNLMSWALIFLGTFVLLIAGYWIYDKKWAWKGRTEYQRLWAILGYGTVALYLVLLVTKIAEVAAISIPLAIGLGINYAIVSLVVVTLAKNLKFLRI